MRSVVEADNDGTNVIEFVVNDGKQPSPSPTPPPTPKLTPPPTPTPTPKKQSEMGDGKSSSKSSGSVSLPPTPQPISIAPSSSNFTSGNSQSSSNSSMDTVTKGSIGGPLPPQDKPHLSIGAIVGICVGTVAIVLMIAAFTIWYRRFKRSGSFSKKSPRPNASSSATTANFSTINTGRMMNNRADMFVSTGSGHTNQSGTWDDPSIVAAKIPLEKVETHALISRGGYGEVYRGLYKGQVVAIKKLLPATRKDLKHIEAFFAEVKLMIALEHTRIVQFIGVAWDSLSDVCVLSEFMDGGDLRTLLMRFEVSEQRPHGFDYDKVKIALHVIHALTYLHSLLPIVLHRDLKSKNILLSAQWDAKLTDFGVSREQSDATMTAGVGTSLWMAPEVMMGEQYNEKADIFSFGVVLSELDSHLLPYAHAKNADTGQKLTDTAILQLVSMGRLCVQFSEDVLPELRELGEACVAVEPKERPTAAEVLYKLQLALKTLTQQQS
ncbi:Tkl protein kinase, partial [Globisporangium splendens]